MSKLTDDYTVMLRIVHLVDDLGGCCTVREFLRRNEKKYTEKTARNHLDAAAQHKLLVKRRDDSPDRANVNCVRYELPGYNNREIIFQEYNPNDIKNSANGPGLTLKERKELMRYSRKVRVSVRTVRK